MKQEPTSIRLSAVLELYTMQTHFFERALVGIREEDAIKRLQTKANHISWITGSLVQERFELANLIGLDLKSSADRYFSAHQGINEEYVYPSLDSYKADWQKISPILKDALLNLEDHELDRMLEFPGMRFTLLEMITFQTYREASCIGQIALWRRLLDYEPMNYM